MYLLTASVLALSLLHVGRADYLDKTWAAYKKRHGKQYDGSEDKFRYSVWSKYVQRVQQHNLEFDIGMHSYTLGVNEYSDLTQEEYRKYLLGFRKPNVTKYTHTASYFRPPAGVKLPKRVDWRERGFVTPIKNQGRCGSCWAFSSTGALEGQHFNVTGYLVSLSEQQLVDCVKANAGCNGGWMDNAFEYIYKNQGIDVEYGYPYKAKDEPCHFDPEYVAAEDFGYSNIRSGSEHDLQVAVATVGPISVAIDANHESFMQYRSGVYDEPKCTQATDHAVLVVGYGTHDGKDYWLVKNSWGTSWGMDGYIMMSRNKDNQCAIADYASYPIV